ncbi:carbonyl reductase [Sporormia fimetaria CBS 119925]|uniref:Carbonyl reductase n=1 Tax=Sporormia fimetaria CBS 119925 TaxID=1340428 RepID=A0A6A6VPH9_9PLEO|nr:carbonyl reductase [Sporormia fimetaria CBS 119925]
MAPQDITKPIALITGANKSIGFTLARSLARDHSFHILLCSRSPERGATAASELRSQGLSVDAITLDLTSDASILSAAAHVRTTYGRLNVLVNNAAIILDGLTVPSETLSVRELAHKTFDTNVFGTYAVTEAFLPLLHSSLSPQYPQHGPPRIVFLSSTLGSVSDRLSTSSVYDGVGSEVYRCSKAATNMLGGIYARRFLESGWKVSVVCPGYVKTDMNAGQGMVTVEGRVEEGWMREEGLEGLL